MEKEEGEEEEGGINLMAATTTEEKEKEEMINKSRASRSRARIISALSPFWIPDDTVPICCCWLACVGYHYQFGKKENPPPIR